MMKQILSLILLLFSFNAIAQYDSTKTLQDIQATGYTWKNAQVKYSQLIPRDTTKLALKDSGAIAYKGGKLWLYNGRYWVMSSADPARFGVEDNTATQDRFMDLNNQSFAIFNGELDYYDLPQFRISADIPGGSGGIAQIIANAKKVDKPVPFVSLLADDVGKRVTMDITNTRATIKKDAGAEKEIVTSVNNVLADSLGNVDITSITGGKLNISDTANLRLRPIAGTKTTITGTYPNLTFNSTGIDGGLIDSAYFWKRTGNQATAGSDFLGTTNNSSLRFRTNDIERLLIDSVGSFRFAPNGYTAGSQSAFDFTAPSTTEAKLVIRPTSNTFHSSWIFTLASKDNVNYITNGNYAPLVINTTGGYVSSYLDMWGGSIRIHQNSKNISLNNVVDNGYKLDLTGTSRFSDVATFSNLSGIGTRMVVADATGILSTQSIPVGGGGSSTDTSSISSRINNAYSTIQSSLDSSYFVITKPNGGSDTIEIQTYSGGSGGGGVVLVKQVHTTGATLTINNATTWLIVKPTLSSLTITLPASPTDGQRIDMSFKLFISSLVVLPNSGQTIKDAFGLTSIEAAETINYQYDATDSIWYRL